ncbi:symporter small accessory protein [Gaoshiqia sediminis]|uniref:Uncharacterized protein n=1 Tax=Gaoshiqia sediminis TaxID=2986998 RepID=A0AA42C9T5_9BACT|nr:symporter small accessory protein [Gaoshiqia sediminis]MCW0482882.1 hypothetical protein [Gaoshiqia sediminis]
MLGIDDPGIYLGYLLSVLSLVACVWYGAANWNKGAEITAEELKRDIDWETKEDQINEEL